MSAVNLVLALAVFNHSAVQAARVLLALYILDFGARPLTVGLLAGTFSLFPMALSVVVGKTVDRIGARIPLVAGAISGALGMLLPWLLPGIPAIFAGAMAVGLCTAIFNVSLQNMVGLLGHKENRSRDFSNYSMMTSTASLLGPLIAGFSIDHVGHATACVTVAAITLVPISLLLLRGGLLLAPASSSKPAAKKAGLMTLLEGPGVRRTLATGSLQNAGDSLYQFYMPVYTHSIGLSASVIGIVLAMNSAAAFVVRVVLPRMIRRFGEQRLLAYAFYMGAAALLLIPLFRQPVVLAVISFVFGLGMGCTGPIVTMLMFSNSPPGRSGEAVGLKVTANHFTKVVSPVIFGTVAGAFGLLAVFWMNAMVLASGGWLSRPTRSEDPAQTGPDTGAP